MRKINEDFHERLMLSVNDADGERLEGILSERVSYIEGISNKEKRMTTVQYFLEKDKELSGLIRKKQSDIQKILMNQNNQQKIIDKYEKF